MGLKELTMKDFKSNKKVLKCLEFYGITEKHLLLMKLLPELVDSLQAVMNYLKNEKTNSSDLTEHLNYLNEEIEELRTYDR